ncbi:MAG: hypothetical protein PHY93_08570 [Bacteriovorax sp.]|nr:hypothetical protein [Bacteriovorax sp.]
MIDMLNASFTKINLTSCADLTPTRITDIFTIHALAAWVGSDDPNFPMKLVHATAQKAGMEKRVEIYAGVGYPLGAIVEFTCDMKKGYLVQTGRGGPGAGADLMETYWDNSTGVPDVQFRIVGPTDGDVLFARSNGTLLTLGTMSYLNLTAYLTAFGLNYATLNPGLGW